MSKAKIKNKDAVRTSSLYYYALKYSTAITDESDVMAYDRD